MRPISDEEILHELTTDGRDPNADEALVIRVLLGDLPVSEGGRRSYFVREEVARARDRYDVISSQHVAFEAAYNAHWASGRYHGDAGYAFRSLIEEVLTLSSRWDAVAEGATDFNRLVPDAKKLFFYEEIAPSLAANDFPVLGTAEAFEVVQSACKQAFLTPRRALAECEYETLAAFEADFEPMQEAGLSAMVYAGMGTRRESHDRSLKQIITAINVDSQHAMRLDPVRNHDANQYSRLRAICTRITVTLKDDVTLLGRIRGPWAAKVFDQFDDGGELVRYPHLAPDELKRFAQRSRGYRSLRIPPPTGAAATSAKARRKHALTKEEALKRGGEQIRLMARITAHTQAEEARAVRARVEHELEDEADEMAWDDITDMVLSMQANDAQALLSAALSGENVDFSSYAGAATQALALRWPGPVNMEIDLQGNDKGYGLSASINRRDGRHLGADEILARLGTAIAGIDLAAAQRAECSPELAV